MKATAVCPEGNELEAVLSRHSSRTVYFKLFTDMAVNRADNPKTIVLSLKLLSPFIPAKFRAYMLATVIL